MTSLTKIRSYTDKEWEICVDSGFCFIVRRRVMWVLGHRYLPPGSHKSGFPEQVVHISRSHYSWTLPCPPGELFLAQIALCMEYYIPPREHVAIGSCLEPILSPPPKIGQRCKDISTLESALGRQEKGRGPFQLGMEDSYQENGGLHSHPKSWNNGWNLTGLKPFSIGKWTFVGNGNWLVGVLGTTDTLLRSSEVGS